MGRPLAPDNRRLDALREAAEPARSHRSVPVAGGRADVDLVLGRNEVTLLELTPVVDETPEWWSDDRLFGLGGEGAGASADRP
jgi:xylan 1,4-beta-xylosidase